MSDLRMWAHGARAWGMRPHLGWTAARGQGVIVELSAFGRAMEVGVCRAHSTMAHSIDEGRECCRGRLEADWRVAVVNDLEESIYVTEMSFDHDLKVVAIHVTRKAEDLDVELVNHAALEVTASVTRVGFDRLRVDVERAPGSVA